MRRRNVSGAGVLRRLSPAAAAVAAAAVTLAGLLAGCATRAPTVSGPAAQSSGNTKIAVVAAENFWGSIAAQVGGEHVTVPRISASPGNDPYDHDTDPAEGPARAPAQYAIATGAGDSAIRRFMSSGVTDQSR